MGEGVSIAVRGGARPSARHNRRATGAAQGAWSKTAIAVGVDLRTRSA
jgi:hypothetical protein